MDTTASLVRALKARTGIESDYGIAKRLGISKQAASGYATGRHTLGDDVALQVAAELALDPGYVLACMAHERAKRPPLKQAWERVAKRLAHAAIFLLCVGVTWWLDVDLETVAQAAFSIVGYTHYAHSEHYVCWAGVAFAVALLLRALQAARDRP